MSLLLFPQGEVQGSGYGKIIGLGEFSGKILRLQLHIDRISVGERLDIALWGSSDGEFWGPRPLVVLPHKYYCGNYSYHLDLGEHSSVRYLRVEYRVSEGLPGTMEGHRPPVALMAIDVEQAAMALSAHA